MTSLSQPTGPRERGSGSPDRPDRASTRPDGGSTRPDGASTSARQQSENGSQSPVVRRPLILAAGCGALILLLLLSVGGVFAVRAIIGPDDQETAHSQEESDGEGEETAETGGEGADDPSAEDPDVPADAKPQGTTIEHTGEAVDGTVDVSIGEVDWDATERVQEQDQLVDQPPAGQKYIMVEAELTYHGPEEFTPLAWASINFVGPDGTVYPDAGMATPSDAEQETSSDGQSQTQQWVFLVPEELPEGGHFVIGDFGPVEEGQWIEAV